MKKNLLSLTMIGALALSMAACGGRKNSNNTTGKPGADQNKPVVDGTPGGADDTTTVSPLAEDQGKAILTQILSRVDPSFRQQSTETAYDKYKVSFESDDSQALLEKISTLGLELKSVKDDVTGLEDKDIIETAKLILQSEDKTIMNTHEILENKAVSLDVLKTKTYEAAVSQDSTRADFRIVLGCVENCTKVGVAGRFKDAKAANVYFGFVFTQNANKQYELSFSTSKTKKIEDFKSAFASTDLRTDACKADSTKCDTDKEITAETCRSNPLDTGCEKILNDETANSFANILENFCDAATDAAVKTKCDAAKKAATDSAGTDTPAAAPAPTDTPAGTPDAATPAGTPDAAAPAGTPDAAAPVDTPVTTAPAGDDAFDFSKLDEAGKRNACNDNIMIDKACVTIGGMSMPGLVPDPKKPGESIITESKPQSYTAEVKEQCGVISSEYMGMSDTDKNKCDLELKKIDSKLYDAKMKAIKDSQNQATPAGANSALDDKTKRSGSGDHGR